MLAPLVDQMIVWKTPKPERQFYFHTHKGFGARIEETLTEVRHRCRELSMVCFDLMSNRR